jgi:hypothetical protein
VSHRAYHGPVRTGVTPARLLVLGLLVGCLVACGPNAESSPSPGSSFSTSATPTSLPSDLPPSATPADAVLRWTEASSFGEAGASEYATAITEAAGGFVAVGTHYDRPLFVDDSWPPHGGRVWKSPDGRSWVDATPPGTFVDAILNHVFGAADGSLVAVGTVTDPNRPNNEDPGPLTAWASADGLSWSTIESGFPAGYALLHLEQGARGTLATLSNYTNGPQLWLSADGRHWEQVYEGADDEHLLSVGAGDQGFVAAGQRGTGSATVYFVMASSDGRDWITSSNSPPDAYHVVAVGPDWVATGCCNFQDAAKDSEIPVWFSANGLDWSEVGRMPLRAVSLGNQEFCAEAVGGLATANGRIIASLTLTFPCSEGVFVSYGGTLISDDGMSWERLPFAERSETQAGSFVIAALGAEDGLLLAGQSNRQATFWFGE